MESPSEPPSSTMDNTCGEHKERFAITLEGVSKRFRTLRHEVWALRGVNLQIRPGVFGLLGRNGAGKTTLLQLLATLLEPTSGVISFGRYDARRDRWTIRHHLGYLAQEQGFYPTLTAAETLEYLAVLSGIPDVEMAVRRALEAVNLSDRAGTRVGALSGGMRRRLGLAQALLGDPAVLIVDEPTAGLDPVEQQRFRTLIGTLGAQGNRTILLSTHIVDDVATIANQLAVLERGHLVFQGSVGDLAARARGRAWSWRSDISTVDAARRDGQLLVTSVTPLGVSAGSSGSPTANQVLAHVVGEQPAPDATMREPTLEDGYFTLIGRTLDDDR